MSKQITITNVKNANELDSFVPVEGQWFSDGADDIAVADIEQSVVNYMGAEYKINVQLFQLNGHAITGDMPTHGAFLATRKR